MTTTALKQYNGNISSVSWQSKVPAGSAVTQVKQSYEYTYDQVNRLTLANYTTTGLTGQYNEVLAYDVMGNIVSLSRFQGNAATAIDQLVYTYDNGNLSNTLLSVADNSNNNLGQPGGTATYGYDPNGNLLKDNKKLLTFGYNYLNLPSSVTKTGTGAGTIAYIYDANGRKLRKVMTGANRDYVNGIEYNNTGTLEFIQTEEGRARPNGGSYFYEYALKDHLGNTRVLIGQDGVISQQTDYYAFGMEMSRGVNVTPSPDNKYKYNGKELQDELGMNLYDYGARFYDPVIARWTTVDKLAEDPTQIDLSPYAYVGNNPILKDDPDGNCPLCEMAIAGLIGGIVDYGEQVATNYVTGKDHIFTNVNGAEILTSAGSAFLTGGGSIIEGTGAKVALKVGVAVVNNTVDINPSKGFKVTVNTDVVNVAKKAATDLVIDGAAGKVGGKVENVLSKVGVTNAGRLSNTAKKVVNALGQNVTRATTASVKAGLKKATTVAAKTTESTVKVAAKKVVESKSEAN